MSAAPEMYRCRNCGAFNTVSEVCRLCGGELSDVTASALREAGACVECGIRPRASVEGYCELCDPPLAPPEPIMDDRPFLPEEGE